MRIKTVMLCLTILLVIYSTVYAVGPVVESWTPADNVNLKTSPFIDIVIKDETGKGFNMDVTRCEILTPDGKLIPVPSTVDKNGITFSYHQELKNKGKYVVRVYAVDTDGNKLSPNPTERTFVFESLTLYSLVVKGGYLMIPIALCSVIALIFIIERFISLGRAKSDTEQFMKRIKEMISRGDRIGAINLCDSTRGPVASMVKAGLEKHDQDRNTIKDIMESAGKTEVYQLEKNLGILSTIAGVAPLLGFLGTVTGMVRTFMQIEALGGNVDASVLSGGIWEALLTTVAGLSVGIPVTLFYNYFVGRVEKFVFELEKSSSTLLDLIEENKKPKSA